jgi:hypothetical protein
MPLMPGGKTQHLLLTVVCQQLKMMQHIQSMCMKCSNEQAEFWAWELQQKWESHQQMFHILIEHLGQ